LGVNSPIVLFYSHFWTKEEPIYTLIQQLSEIKNYNILLVSEDTLEEVIGLIKRLPPI